ncbi:MAG: hypothetical protein KKE02_00935 [Alphaproteobacteria bacterium]|nr:hypothetical protein [Alphaproteobacteria bacterium]MBU1515754.1 hypothetical protein [Alphaproteobacteria bacterium]MBU2097037.1 hypothetical protein [Alphaproteobacteria bacterium]MBU2149553.1 hypothetical protein [Alphaproteobacteria bacterium]MBU2308939.1 hypothetical protein [Alphaproteobacteria bacterium]
MRTPFIWRRVAVALPAPAAPSHAGEPDQLVAAKIVGEWLAVILKILASLAGILIAFVLGWLTIDMFTYRGLVVEPFSVPEDFAKKGLNGEAVASEVLDRLAVMQAKSDSLRAASSYTNDWGDRIKVEIPQTGVSIGELQRFLRQLSGNGTRISGIVYLDGDKIHVTARAGSAPSRPVEVRTFSEWPQLMQAAAEGVYNDTQPYRYGVYLRREERREEAKKVFRDLSRALDGREAAWGFRGLGLIAEDENEPELARSYYSEALPLTDNKAALHYSIALLDEYVGHSADSLTYYENVFKLTKSKPADVAKSAHARMRLRSQMGIAQFKANFRETVRIASEDAKLRGYGQLKVSGWRQAGNAALGHDISESNRLLAGTDGRRLGETYLRNTYVGLSAELSGEYPKAVAGYESAMREADLLPWSKTRAAVQTSPGYARALALSGRFAEANILAGGMPTDCYPCNVARADVYALQKDWKSADSRYQLAIKQAPGLPLAYMGLARSYLARGREQAALGELKRARRAGPNWADPLELEGEILLRRGDAHGALTKFRAADTLAPKWARNRMMTGIALARLGEGVAARAMWSSALDVTPTPSERAWLEGALKANANPQVPQLAPIRS